MTICNKKVLAVIPARIGSKGIVKKNLLRIGKYSLVERALITAINNKFIDKIVVTTDSTTIQNKVNKFGNYAPFIRPKNLSTDRAGSLGVMKHSLNWAQNAFNIKFDYIVLLEPPAPFRLPKHISKALKLAIDKNATSVVSLVEVEDHHPIRMKKMNQEGMLSPVTSLEPDGLRRQDQAEVYIRNCAVYVFETKTIRNNKLWGDKPYGFLMNKKLYGINIDNILDYISAKYLHKEHSDKKTLAEIESLEFK